MARIAILFHARDRGRDLRRYAIVHLAEVWRARGDEVVFAFGPSRPPSATIAILHVDLSVVPDAYTRLADRYPLVLNSRITDIRKSVHSRLRVRAGDRWDGPVIVKSDLNHAGLPERGHRGPWTRLRARVARIVRRPRDSRSVGAGPRQYPVFARLADVPAGVHADASLIVEKFLPERAAAGYAVRSCYLLGGAMLCERAESTRPVVRDATALRIENVEPHPSLPRLAAELRLDYGKLDYTVHDGELVLLDVNKTVGSSVTEANPMLRANRARWAAGLKDFLEGRRAPL